MLHANIPKKEIVDRPHVLGMSIVRSGKCSCEHLKENSPVPELAFLRREERRVQGLN